MLLSDSSIKGLIKAGVIANATEANVGTVSYDLRTLEFYPKDGRATEVELLPGNRSFGSQELIRPPSMFAASVMLRNSRIRQGLSLDAPLFSWPFVQGLFPRDKRWPRCDCAGLRARHCLACVRESRKRSRTAL